MKTNYTARSVYQWYTSKSPQECIQFKVTWVFIRDPICNKQHAHGAPMIGPEMCVPSLYRLAMAQLAAREFPALPELPLGLEFPTFLERLLLDN